MKRILLFLTALLLLCGGCTAAPNGPPTFEAQKLGEISDKILTRQVVESSYLYYLGHHETLRQNITRYNELTATLTGNATNLAASLLLSLYDLQDGDTVFYGTAKDYPAFPPYMREQIVQIAHLSLYENSGELLRCDPLLSYLIASEGGSSYGLWVSSWHPLYRGVEESDRQLYEEYFALEKAILGQLEDLMAES